MSVEVTLIKSASPSSWVGDLEIFEALNPKAILLLLPGTAVPSRVYYRFAKSSAKRGFTTVCFNYINRRKQYRSIGNEDWIERQIPEVITAVTNYAKELPVFVIGHSLGANAMGFGEAWDKLAGVVRVGATSGYVWWTRRPFYNAFRVYILAPILVMFTGRAPLNWVGMGEMIPRRAALQLARLCGSRGYFHKFRLKAGERLLAKYPVLDLWTSDDPLVTSKTRDDLNRFYEFSDRRELEIEVPEKLEVGHSGYFLKRSKWIWPRIWEQIEIWIEKRISK